ncbi:GNAT family N-acetyltransferase [Halioxenophilus aromaticivorans]|uniref:GNAT family N-acetyltransferase n=1 Tax=Halioxenophilus aromaticivorans TaxID=1306992 RepID=A0AAV3TYY0_9ALTE
MSEHALRPLFAPQSVVVLTGVNPQHPAVTAILQSLAVAARPLTVTLAGPRPSMATETPLVTHVDHLSELTDSPDLAILVGDLAAPAPQLIEQCASAGIKFVLMVAACNTPEAELAAATKRYGVRMLGPNSFGICRPSARFFAWLGHTQPLTGRLALMSQSGTIASGLVDWATWQGIGFSQVVAFGLSLDNSMPSQVLDYLASDYNSQSLLMYLKSVGNPTRFLSSLRAAGRTKPVAVVAEHSLGTDERILDAALNRTGAVRGKRLNDLIAAASVMTNARRVYDGSLLIIGNGAGPGEMAVERARELNVPLLQPEGRLKQELSDIIGEDGTVDRITTVWASSAAGRYVELADEALRHKSCGAVLLMLSPTALLDLGSLYDGIVSLQRKQKKLVMVCLIGGGNMVTVRKQITAAGIPTFRTPESAIEGFQFLVQFQRNQRLAKQSPESGAVRLQIDVENARAIIQAHLDQGLSELHFSGLTEILEQFNICVAPGVEKGSDIKTPLHVRMFRDPVFGPIIGLAFGGSEQWHRESEAIALPPLNTVLIKDLIQQILPDAESYLLENLLLGLSTLVCEIPELHSIDLADLRVGQDSIHGGDISARLVACPNLRRYEHLAIQPYPRHWVSEFRMRNGDLVAVRPVRPEDAPIMADFVRGLSKEARYYRFMANIVELTPRMLARFTHIDYDREMALVAVVEDDGIAREIGAARYSDNFDGHSCEFSIVLADEYQGQGLAAYLMRRLFCIAADKGFPVMEGTVLANNRHMIDFCRKLGFSIRRDADDAGMVIAAVVLSPQFIEQVKVKLDAGAAM